jgi:hypothetical protein
MSSETPLLDKDSWGAGDVLGRGVAHVYGNREVTLSMALHLFQRTVFIEVRNKSWPRFNTKNNNQSNTWQNRHNSGSHERTWCLSRVMIAHNLWQKLNDSYSIMKLQMGEYRNILTSSTCIDETRIPRLETKSTVWVNKFYSKRGIHENKINQDKVRNQNAGSLKNSLFCGEQRQTGEVRESPGLSSC